MLTAERNELLTQVGPGTRMGALLRRYWWPIAAVSQLDETATKAVRLLGEDLVLYKDLSGTFGLIDRHCPHRGASLEFGSPEACGLRCSYHGWLFNEKGSCVERPFEDLARPRRDIADRFRIKAYSVREKAGVLFAYLGPEPAPCLWDWDFFYTRGYKQIAVSEVPCNWLQFQENAIDPVHFEWLHLNWSRRQQGIRESAPRHLRIGFEEFDYGFIYRRIVEGQSEQDDAWTVGRVCLWPNCLFAGAFDWNVPIDDENTLRMVWMVNRLPGERPVLQSRIPYWSTEPIDRGTNRWRTARFANQDCSIIASQGRVADRTREHLGLSDRGVILLRQRFLADLRALDEGIDPKNLLRDPTTNNRLMLPLAADQLVVPAKPPECVLEGQPKTIRREMEELWLEHGS
jgi:5,5'-dehydrodivanillate O-demethylase oxygenase subunit